MRWTPLAEIVTAERILGWTRTVRETWWAPIVLILAYTPAAFVLLPRPLLTLVSVMTFGVLLGLVYATSGVMLAALVTYFAGRRLPKKTLQRLAGDALEPAGKLLREHGVVAVFGANMLPTPPFVVQNMIAGAVKHPPVEVPARHLPRAGARHAGVDRVRRPDRQRAGGQLPR